MHRFGIAVLVWGVCWIAWAGGEYKGDLVRLADLRPGDVLFHSSPKNELSNAIEDATDSAYSHCGMVVLTPHGMGVIEAIGPVQVIPVEKWIARGRGKVCDVYRLKEQHREHVPAMILFASSMRGRPYDFRYRMDDEKIYCSELVWKDYRRAAKEHLGEPVALGSLKWGPHVALIKRLEGGPVPLERKMITPVDLSQAKQLENIGTVQLRSKKSKSR